MLSSRERPSIYVVAVVRKVPCAVSDAIGAS